MTSFNRSENLGDLAKPLSLSVRFWRHVDKTPGFGPRGDCWMWTGATDDHGYGTMGVRKENGKRTLIFAHRVAWFLQYGKWPQPCALHSCDVSGCVRVSHLFEGSQADNMKDMASKKRSRNQDPKGSRNGRAVVNEAAVAAIRSDFTAGLSRAELAEKYAQPSYRINQIIRRETWRHC